MGEIDRMAVSASSCHVDDRAENEKWKAAGGMKMCSDIVEKTAWMLYEIIEKE